MIIKTIIGLILLFIPFLLIEKFENKRKAVFYILSFLIGFHLFVAIITQAFGIFNYEVIIGINLLVAGGILFKSDRSRILESLKKIKIDWILIFVLLVLFIQLYSVHYNYTGKANGVERGYYDIEHMNYPYPYYSDEWSTISWVQYSIDYGKLPLVNPLWENVGFPNVEVAFSSFIAGLVLLLGLNPLINYTILTIFSGLLISLLVYFILRFNRVGKMASAIVCLFIPYLVCGGNLPGIWMLMPMTLGVISFLFVLLFISFRNTKMIFFNSFLMFLFYPPFIVLLGLSLLSYFIIIPIDGKKKIKEFIWFLIISALAIVSLLILTYFSRGYFNNVFYYILSKIFYETFTNNAIPGYFILKIIPLPIVFFGVLGLFKNLKRKLWLIFPIIVGLIYWVAYSRVLWRFIIEYQRVLFITSILIFILAGFGIQLVINYLRKLDFIKKYKIIEILFVIIFSLFLISAFSYTKREAWRELNLRSLEGEVISGPAAPAGVYLLEDDLKLFEGIKNEKFISVPWKGLVIGVATKNYPLHSKASTITNYMYEYNAFLFLNCEEKIKLAKQDNINYIYSSPFDCSGFELIGISSEGFHLYHLV